MSDESWKFFRYTVVCEMASICLGLNVLNVAICFLLQADCQEMFMPKVDNFSYLHEK